MTLEDKELAALFMEGGEASFHELYVRHAPALLAFIRRLLGRRSDQADDAFQEVWLRAVRDLRGFQWSSSFRTWIFGIAVNRCREIARAASRHPETLLECEPIEHPVPSGERIDLERALSSLSLRYREVLVLHDIHHYTHGEIASLLGIDTGTSKSNLSRGRSAMRELMQRGAEVRP